MTSGHDEADRFYVVHAGAAEPRRRAGWHTTATFHEGHRTRHAGLAQMAVVTKRPDVALFSGPTVQHEQRILATMDIESDAPRDAFGTGIPFGGDAVK